MSLVKRFGKSGEEFFTLLSKASEIRRAEEIKFKQWRDFCERRPMNALVQSAVSLHEFVHDSTKGVYFFKPGHAIISMPSYCILDRTGRKGFPLSWCLDADDETVRLFRQSSDIETALHERVSIGELIESPVIVSGKRISSSNLNRVFRNHGRGQGEYNFKHRVVESAFYHLNGLGQKYRVKGFDYPHPAPSKVGYASAN